MKVSEHIVYGSAASLALAPVFGVKTAFFLVGSLAIDLDHYLDFLYYGQFKNWSFKKMFEFHGVLGRWKERPNFMALEAFHTVEFLLAFLLVAWIAQSTELYLLFAGMCFHLVLDMVRLSQWNKIGNRALSFIEYWIRSRKMIQAGVHPEKIFEEAYASIEERQQNPDGVESYAYN
ncbi:MAG: hypothetical protein HYY63_02120 [Elusimicrobia bacterium]|nr:hypothetical protein [Elusimicrobiota bacterium]MBI3012399.1 hypothetical protein [Elusimicrobiota bacterium]MBI4218192.1 hypothetical protein [Elusimicrobiota bacterium]